MRTERVIWPNLPLVAVILGIAVLAGALAVRYGVMSGPGGTPTTLPADITALGTAVTALDPDGTISRDQALTVARDQIGGQFVDAQIETYLVSVVDPSTAGLNDRGVWIIKVSGISVSVPGGPPRPDGTIVSRRATLAYVYVDAFTGEWITTAMQITGG